jgi:hypothetical protein
MVIYPLLSTLLDFSAGSDSFFLYQRFVYSCPVNVPSGFDQAVLTVVRGIGLDFNLGLFDKGGF